MTLNGGFMDTHQRADFDSRVPTALHGRCGSIVGPSDRKEAAQDAWQRTLSWFKIYLS